MIGRAAGMRGRDPVRRLRARLTIPSAELEKLESEIDESVREAVTEGLASLEEVSA